MFFSTLIRENAQSFSRLYGYIYNAEVAASLTSDATASKFFSHMAVITIRPRD